MLEIASRRVRLRDGSEAVLRPLTGRDTDSLHRMFQTLPPKARRFLDDDVTKMEVIRRWTSHIEPATVLPLVVEVGSEIVADGTLHRRTWGPTRHVGRIRVVVAEGWQGKGIGTLLTEELVRIATREGLRIVQSSHAEFEEGEAVEAMKALGFRRVAILPEHLMDPEGRTHAATVLVRRLGQEGA
jgi:GNAT superfamily N-acetyltransferase